MTGCFFSSEYFLSKIFLAFLIPVWYSHSSKQSPESKIIPYVYTLFLSRILFHTILASYQHLLLIYFYLTCSCRNLASIDDYLQTINCSNQIRFSSPVSSIDSRCFKYIQVLLNRIHMFLMTLQRFSSQHIKLCFFKKERKLDTINLINIRFTFM